MPKSKRVQRTSTLRVLEWTCGLLSAVTLGSQTVGILQLRPTFISHRLTVEGRLTKLTVINKDKQRTLINERLKIPTEGSASESLLHYLP
jgi:hypothetical protein